jgi:hypothetical protein
MASLPLTGDTALDDARADVIQMDQQRQQPAPPDGEQAAMASEMQSQHLADEVCGAARRMYLEMADDATSEISPFERFVVVEMMSQATQPRRYVQRVV